MDFVLKKLKIQYKSPSLSPVKGSMECFSLSAHYPSPNFFRSINDFYSY